MNYNLDLCMSYVIRTVKTDKGFAVRIVDIDLMDVLFTITKIKDNQLIDESVTNVRNNCINFCFVDGAPYMIRTI